MHTDKMLLGKNNYDINCDLKYYVVFADNPVQNTETPPSTNDSTNGEESHTPFCARAVILSRTNDMNFCNYLSAPPLSFGHRGVAISG